MKRDINFYMNTAREQAGISSDRNLAVELNVATVAGWRDPYRPKIPERNVMVRLAELANMPAHIALIDRDIWVASFKAPETVPIYEKILKKFPQYAAALIITFVLSVAPVDFEGGNSAYAGEKSGAQTHEQFILWNILSSFCSSICSAFRAINRMFTPSFYPA